MKRLYAPWRTAYTKQEKKQGSGSDSCVFCSQLSTNSDDEFFIIKRYDHCALMLNLFPYNAGHLLMVPYQHGATLQDLPENVQASCMKYIAHTTHIVTHVLQPEGFNIGINIGKAGGASIVSHVHIHILPRWFGDTNFLPTLTDTKQISVDLLETFKLLKSAFNNSI
jgi:ATP adenylyltransferase